MQESKYSFIFSVAVSAVFLLALASVFIHFFVERTYEVRWQVSCDPKKEVCFVSDCAANDSTCDSKITYKKIVAPSKYAGSDFANFFCEVGNPHCKVITCSPETAEEGEKCFQ